MVKRWDRMKGINLDPEKDHVYINESYDHFLRTMYGKKFPHQFVAMVNDLLDSGIIETLDDMKKVIRYFEWKMEKNNKRVRDLTAYTAAMEESLQRVKDYAVALEERLAKHKEESRGALKPVKARGGEVGAESSETEATRRQIMSAEELLARLKGEEPDVEKDLGEERAEGEIAASDSDAIVEPELERPPELESGVSPFTPVGPPGGRRTEAEIGADEIEITPKIRAIENMIKEVKKMEALHSDEEIEKIFKASNPPQGQN